MLFLQIVQIGWFVLVSLTLVLVIIASFMPVRKISTDLSNKGHNTVYYRKFKNFDSVGFRYDIFHQKWSNIKNCVHANAMWDA